jgi:Zn-dependent protease
VPIDPRRMRTGYQTGMLLTGIAGPCANIALAIAFAIVYRILALMPAMPGIVLSVVGIFVELNLLLVFFNLIPIPPFDGSRVLQWFLRGAALDFYQQMERYGFVIIVVLIFVIPQFTGFDPLSAYLGATVLPLTRFLLGVG